MVAQSDWLPMMIPTDFFDGRSGSRRRSRALLRFAIPVPFFQQSGAV
jgi:hypothetical protein